MRRPAPSPALLSRPVFRLLPWLLMAVALFLAPRGAVGQPAAPASSASASAAAAPADSAGDAEATRRKEEAKQRFLRGIELIQDENWDAALAEFLASRELFPTRAAIKNAATALRQLKRYAEALAMYREYMAKFGSSAPPDELKQMQEAMAQVNQYVGEIEVQADQPGATVVIDGQDRGATPLEAPVVVNAGTHSVRVFKEGFVPHEEQLLVAGGQKKAVKVTLKALAKSGRLKVAEAGGAVVDVVVDGAVVGKTPWEGTLSVGTHTVLLAGDDDLGTPPSAATVFENQTSTLTLRATTLDAGVRIEPTPSNALVFVDGVQIGAGSWEGRLKSGSHKLEVTARGFLAYRRDVKLKSGESQVVRVVLERDLSDPMWRDKAFIPHVYVEAMVGGAFAPSLGGSADVACSRGECSARSRPTGFIAGGRGGYQLTSGLGVELFLGYLSLSESMTRSVQADGENATAWIANDYEDSTTIAGPAAALAASYQFLEQTPLLFRLSLGVARMKATFENSGTFQGTVESSKARYESRLLSVPLAIPEDSPRLWMPFVGAESRFGYRFSKSFLIDVGIGINMFLAPETARQGTSALSGEGTRADARTDTEFYYFSGQRGTAGVLNLPIENGFDTFFAVIPSIGGRFDF